MAERLWGFFCLVQAAMYPGRMPVWEYARLAIASSDAGESGDYLADRQARCLA
jgi:hypothetical protein